MPARRMTAFVAMSVSIACAEPAPREASDTDTSALRVETRLRGTLDRVGDDSLLHAVRITALFPEPDGEAIPMLFGDTGRNVSAGLAIVDARGESPQLLWPDSVTDVWWSGDHELTFTTATGRGAYVIVDVHEAAVDSLAIATRPPGPRPDTTDAARRGRAQRHIDSLRAQPAGRSESGRLSYTVTRWIADPSRAFAAFHATARDSSGRLVNPAWYITDIGSGAVTLVDEIVGPAEEMPSDAGGWTEDQRFVYAKGANVHEAQVRRSSSGRSP